MAESSACGTSTRSGLSGNGGRFQDGQGLRRGAHLPQPGARPAHRAGAGGRRGGGDVPPGPPGPHPRPAHVEPQPPGPGPVRDQRPGPGGHPGRLGVGPAGGVRHRPALLPRLRRRADPGHDPLRGVPGRAGPGRRPQLRRPADAQPLGLPAAEHHHRFVPHRHPAAPRRRLGPGVGHPGRRPGHRLLVRRGGVVEGRLPRGPELRRHPPPAGGLRVREQPVRHLGDDGPPVGRARRGRPGLVLRHAGGDRRRQRHPGGVRGDAIGRGPGPVGGRSVARRVQDLPAHAPHVRRRRPPLPQSGGGAGVAGARPPAPAAPVPGRAGTPVGRRGRGHGAGGAGRDRRGRPAGGGGGPAVARDGLPPGVRQAAAAHAGRPGGVGRGAGPGPGGAAAPGHGRGPHRARHRPPDAARPDGRGRAGGAPGRGRGRARGRVPGHRRSVLGVRAVDG